MSKKIHSILLFFALLFANLTCVTSQLSSDEAPSHFTSATPKLKIAFYTQGLLVRGTEVAVYDYADFNETLLGNESFIIYLPNHRVENFGPDNPITVKDHFSARFKDRFFECSSLHEMDEILLKEKIDILYVIKSGQIDGKESKVIKNAIHAVFPPLQVHGDIYASVSEWLSLENPALNVPFVPHMIRLDETAETLHEELGIPHGSVVFGRHGGVDTFDIPFAQDLVVELALAKRDWYFIFLNTRQFCHLPNVIFLPSTPDIIYKTKFINTCDAMIHARYMGESFGLACGEFSIKNKPVITWTGSYGYHRSHIDILKDKGFYYSNKNELRNVLLNCGNNIETIRGTSWDAYSEKYSPEVVMKKFDQVFIQPLTKHLDQSP